jgi:hypothetical protein
MVDIVMDPNAVYCKTAAQRSNFSKIYSSTNTALNEAATLKTTASCSTCSGYSTLIV